MAPARLTRSYATFLYFSLYLNLYLCLYLWKVLHNPVFPRVDLQPGSGHILHQARCFPAKHLFWGLPPPRVTKKPCPLRHSLAWPQSWPKVFWYQWDAASGINTQLHLREKTTLNREMPHLGLHAVLQWIRYGEEGNILRDRKTMEKKMGDSVFRSLRLKVAYRHIEWREVVLV